MWQRLLEGMDRRQLVFWTVYLGIGTLLFLNFFVWVPQARYKSAVAESKANAHRVQLAIERFAVDTEGSYPHDFAELREVDTWSSKS